MLNGFSELVLAVFGHEVGDHARTAIGVTALPLNLPVVVAAGASQYRALQSDVHHAARAVT